METEVSDKVLVIDDDQFVIDLLEEFLTQFYRVKVALSAEQGIKKLQSFKPDIVLLDIRMPQMDGFEALEVIRKLAPECKVIMITANQDSKSAVRCMKLGAYDYLEKPFDIDEVKLAIDRARSATALAKQVTRLEEALQNKYSFNTMISSAKAMEPVLFMMQKVMNTDSNVLLRGESGTGKELAARIIHYNSLRMTEPFVAVNTGAIPETLLEAELFGFEKGSFTGADNAKPGKFELAGAGTVFLDEIGLMPYALQSKILRVIQEREFTRIGGSANLKLRARVIAATNVNLEEAIERNQFRKDLFYRLNTLPIFIPPLRDHREDIPLLVKHFISVNNQRLGKSIEGMDEHALFVLREHSWPGNVRELENFIERVVVLTKPEERIITVSTVRETIDLFTFSPKNRSVLLSIGDSLETMEMKLIKATLAETNGHMIKASEILGITRKTLREKLKKYGMYASFRDDNP